MNGWLFTGLLLVGVLLLSAAVQGLAWLAGAYSYNLFWIVFIGGVVGLFIWGDFSRSPKRH